MKTIAVIPTLNEEENISEVLRKTRRHVDKIIVVDASSDSTPEIVKSRFSDAMLIREKGRGKGLQLRSGMAHALRLEPEYIVQIDGDGERDPADISCMLNVMERDNSDIVIGKREMMRSRGRRMLNAFGLFWINMLTGYGLTDPFSGMMVFRTRALKTMNLKSKGFEIEPEIIMESWKRGLKISETRIRVPKLSKSKFYSMDSLKISTFFDIWVLRNMGSVPPMKRLFLLPFCITGLLLSSIPLFVDRL